MFHENVPVFLLNWPLAIFLWLSCGKAFEKLSLMNRLHKFVIHCDGFLEICCVFVFD